jgi:3-methyladenine DNA glycosylase Mpg
LGKKLWLKEPAKKERKLLDNCRTVALPRVGIKRAKKKKWRFKLKLQAKD